MKEIKNILKDPSKLHIIQKPTDKLDKTKNFMEKYRLTHKDVVDNILQLDISNYSYTDEDDRSGFLGNVWIFGQILLYPLVDRNLVIYIKLKYREQVVCLSFHEAEYDMKFPYN